MEQYANRDGVIVQAELVTEGEHQGLWHAIDKDNIEGYVADESFQRNFTLAKDTPKAKSTKKGEA